MKPISLSFASGLTQPLSQRPHIACELPQPPARGDRLAVPVVAVARALRTASRWLARRDEARQLPPRIEHARLHRGFAHADDLGRLLDRFAVVVDEVNDLAVLRRQLCQRLRKSSRRRFSCKAASGLSAGSATVEVIRSSNSVSTRARRADSAL